MKGRLGMKRISVCILLILFSYITTTKYVVPYFNSIKTVVYKYGSKDTVVTQIQNKLKGWGYYKGNIDGKYGYETYLSVKEFQRKNGLLVDGIVGDRTLAAIGINVPNNKENTQSTNGSNISNSEVMLLARIINGEARGEPYEGQVAVGAVILNRTRNPNFPNTIPGVVYQPGAFTAIVDGQINADLEESPIKAARDALNGWDPSSGAIYYFNPSTATSSWIWSRPLIKIIGKHRFCS